MRLIKERGQKSEESAKLQSRKLSKVGIAPISRQLQRAIEKTQLGQDRGVPSRRHVVEMAPDNSAPSRQQEAAFLTGRDQKNKCPEGLTQSVGGSREASV